MIRLPGDPLLEARLTQAIADRLRLRRQRARDQGKVLDQQMESAPLGRADRIKFRLLRRQFEGRYVPGLPTAVATGRWAVRILRRWRWDA